MPAVPWPSRQLSWNAHMINNVWSDIRPPGKIYPPLIRIKHTPPHPNSARTFFIFFVPRLP
jgi:hypothetical protein